VNRDQTRELTVFALLLAIGVVGRWYQLTWNVTPLAAVTVLGGYYFRQLLPAILLPVGILTVSNLLLPTYPYWQVQLSVYVMMLVPLLLGRLVLGRLARGGGATPWQRAKSFALCGFVPATLFFVITNFAVWAATPYYAKTLSGLVHCYQMGLPFYRWMLAGDFCFLALLVGCLALAKVWTAQPSSGQAA